MVCPSNNSGNLFASRQAWPAAMQTIARTTCISSSSLHSLRQDISATPPEDDLSGHKQELQYELLFPRISMLTGSAVVRPAETQTSSDSEKQAAYDWRGRRNQSASTRSSSSRSRQTDDTSEHPEEMFLASDDESIDVSFTPRKVRRHMPPPRTRTSIPPTINEEDEHEQEAVTDHMTTSLDLSAQEPPPDLSSSVMPTWSYIYEDKDKVANDIIDDLDKSFSPTVEKYENDRDDCSTTTRDPEPEWFAEDKWWRRGSEDGLRKGIILRGPYDSRHTHVVFGSSI